ncbi:hypothetical protein IT157_02135, partial [bacterium]|nr:hypothetical protein [bacterium]
STFNTPATTTLGSRTDSLDQMDFLQMLMAQLQAQDPLSPLSGEEYAAQLAQFSSVQELQKIETALTQSLESNLLMTQSINSNLAAALAGKTVRAQTTTIDLAAAGSATMQFSLPSAATELSVDILDADGEVMRTISLTSHNAGDVSAQWDGRDADGVRVPEGSYSFRVNAKDADGNEITATTFVEGVVDAVNYENGLVTLMINGNSVSLGDVISILTGDATKKG